MRYTVVLEQEPDGGYVVSVPALPGCVSQGDTRAEALANIRDAIALYIEDCREAGDSDPDRSRQRVRRGRGSIAGQVRYPGQEARGQAPHRPVWPRGPSGPGTHRLRVSPPTRKPYDPAPGRVSQSRCRARPQADPAGNTSAHRRRRGAYRGGVRAPSRAMTPIGTRFSELPPAIRPSPILPDCAACRCRSPASARRGRRGAAAEC